MTAVAPPRNNLKEQLAWFAREKPAIPSPIPTTTVNYTQISTGQVIALQTASTQVLRSVPLAQPAFVATAPQREVDMPAPASMRSTALAAPQRPNIKQQRRDSGANNSSVGTSRVASKSTVDTTSKPNGPSCIISFRNYTDIV